MNANDILRRIRYIFDFNDTKVIDIFGQADLEVTREQISDWLKKDDDPVALGPEQLGDQLGDGRLVVDHQHGRRRGRSSRVRRARGVLVASPSRQWERDADGYFAG